MAKTVKVHKIRSSNLFTETHFTLRFSKINGKGMEKNANTDQIKYGLAILISNKSDFQTRKINRDTEGYYKIIMWLIL